MMTRDPIKQPLLKKLENNHDMIQEAVSIFLDILCFQLFFYDFVVFFQAVYDVVNTYITWHTSISEL